LQLLDLAGPAEVLRAANLLGATPRYRNEVVTPDGLPARSDSAVTLTPDASVDDVVADGEPIDVLVVVGGLGVDTALGDEHLRGALRRLAARARRTTSVCTGALLLADAGLLDGRRAATHWASVQHLARLAPTATVEEDPIYVRDGELWTSAGVTAGIDLALALVEDDHGAELAHAVAAWLVVFARRPGGQSQFSAQLELRPARREQLRDLQRWLPEHLGEDLAVPALARRAGMSERTFARAFKDETGSTPAAYVERLRLEAARRLLETTDLTVAAVAAEVGLGGPERLHRAVRRHLGTTPDRYRQHFARSG
jgi:transcriptional regulator GlxA family with amidase domain